MKTEILEILSEITTEDKLVWNTSNLVAGKYLLYIGSDKTQKGRENFYKRLLNKKYAKIITNLEVKFSETLVVSDIEIYECAYTLAQKFYPLKVGLKKIALTGTNGKTTCVDLIRQILVRKKKNILTIGTMGVFYNEEKVHDFNLTSPHFLDFRKTIFNYSEGLEFLAVESSSHAIDQRRQFKMHFDVIGFTSFSQDHLDYHGSLDNYLKTKLKLREQSSSGFVISTKANKLKELLPEFVAHECKIQHKNSFLKTSYNQINLDVVSGILESLGHALTKTEIDSLCPVPGRFNIYENLDQKIIIDFAHTPEALESVLKEAKKVFSKEIITIFGCGGDRDRGKRPLMGKVSQEYSHLTLVTKDNSRSESFMDIASEIVAPLDKGSYKIIEDRVDAITFGIKNFPHACIVIAGKGHEETMEENGKKFFHSDLEVVRNLICD